jgi:hypothetical protein
VAASLLEPPRFELGDLKISGAVFSVRDGVLNVMGADGGFQPAKASDGAGG